MDELYNLFATVETSTFVDELIMKYVSRQKLDGYVGYDQIRWAVLQKILKNKQDGNGHFNLVKLIKKTIKEERAKGNLLPEEWE